MGNKLLGVAVVGESPDPSPLLDNTVIKQEILSFNTNWKVIGSGKIVEVYEYEDSIFINSNFLKAVDKSRLDDDDEIDLQVDPDKMYLHHENRSEEYKQRNINRAKNKVRRLVQHNFDKDGKLLTLTFKDSTKFDITSLDDCHNRFEYFLKKIRHTYSLLKYVAVPEFQDSNGRGAVHYHLVINLPYVPIQKLRRYWRFGFIKINKLDCSTFIGAYIAKYFTKSASDPRFTNHRMFSSSHNLAQPVIKYGDYLKDVVQEIEDKGFKPVYSNTYFSKWCGEIKYRQYNLYQRPAQEMEKNGSD